jgi:hypothetical protein
VSSVRPATRAAIGRPITADLNSDDELIVQMKAEQYTDIAISAALRDRGTIYNDKTISTRWKRIRIKLAEKREAELDAGFVEWEHDHVSKFDRSTTELTTNRICSFLMRYTMPRMLFSA